MMFAAWCTLAAAIAYDLGWRVQFQRRSDLFGLLPSKNDRIVDLAIYFASGRTLPPEDIELDDDGNIKTVSGVDHILDAIRHRLDPIRFPKVVRERV